MSQSTNPDETLEILADKLYLHRITEVEFLNRLEEYITLARIDEAKHYCDEGHYHDKKRDIAMLPSERVEELERLQRDSQPSPYTEALKEHLREHGCGTGDHKSPQYVGGFIHCEVAKELYEKSKDEPDFKPPTGDSQPEPSEEGSDGTP